MQNKRLNERILQTNVYIFFSCRRVMTVAYLSKQINSDIADLLKVIFSVSLGSVGFYIHSFSLLFLFFVFSALVWLT